MLAKQPVIDEIGDERNGGLRRYGSSKLWTVMLMYVFCAPHFGYMKKWAWLIRFYSQVRIIEPSECQPNVQQKLDLLCQPRCRRRYRAYKDAWLDDHGCCGAGNECRHDGDGALHVGPTVSGSTTFRKGSARFLLSGGRPSIWRA